MKKIAALLVSLFFSANAWAKESKELYLYNWSEYLPNSVIQEFTKETGIKVIYSTFDSNEAMFAKVKLLGDKSEYDLIIPSSYYVSKMRAANLLAKLDHSKLSNLKNIDPKFLNNKYDPNNEHSVPYLWGSTGIAYNDKYIKDKIDSWNVLFDPKYRNKVLVMDDLREAFDIALITLGYKSNDTDEAHIKQAYEKLLTLLPNVKMWNSESPKALFINEEVVIGTCWNGEAYMASLENPHIKFAYPKEGAILWVDSFVIPKSAQNADNAYKFINFILRPEIAKMISEKIGYSTPNKETLKILDPKVKNHPVVYPPKSVLDKAEFQVDVGNAIASYTKYWEMLKTGSNSGK